MIKISEFLNGYNMARDKAKYIEPHITVKYVSYEMKITQASQLVKFSMYKNVNEKNVFWANTPMRYQLFTQTVIKMYTDIDLRDGAEDEGAILRGFNKLEESGAMSDIITAIGPDFQRFQTVLQMTTDDAMVNNSLTNWLDTKVDAFGLTLNTIADAIDQFATSADGASNTVQQPLVGTET